MWVSITDFSNESLEQLKQMIKCRVIMCCNKMSKEAACPLSWCLQTKPLLEDKHWKDISYQLWCWGGWGVLPCFTGGIILTLGPDGLFSEEMTWIHACGPILNPFWFLCCLVGVQNRSPVSKSNSKKNHLDVHLWWPVWDWGAAKYPLYRLFGCKRGGPLSHWPRPNSSFTSFLVIE